jgi:hypothetical protein
VLRSGCVVSLQDARDARRLAALCGKLAEEHERHMRAIRRLMASGKVVMKRVERRAAKARTVSSVAEASS